MTGISLKKEVEFEHKGKSLALAESPKDYGPGSKYIQAEGKFKPVEARRPSLLQRAASGFKRTASTAAKTGVRAAVWGGKKAYEGWAESNRHAAVAAKNRPQHPTQARSVGGYSGYSSRTPSRAAANGGMRRQTRAAPTPITDRFFGGRGGSEPARHLHRNVKRHLNKRSSTPITDRIFGRR